MPYGFPNDPDAPYYGQRIVQRTPAEESAISNLARAHEAVQQYATSQGVGYNAAWAEAMNPLAAPGTPSMGGYGSGGGGVGYGGLGGYGGGSAGGGGGASFVGIDPKALQNLISKGVFEAPDANVPKPLRKGVRQAAKKDRKVANRSYDALDKYLKNHRSNAYRGVDVARAPGVEGKQSAAAFQNVLKILRGDTREANKSRAAESKFARQDALSGISAQRAAIMNALRAQALQAQLAQQQWLDQARVGAQIQGAQGIRGGGGGGTAPNGDDYNWSGEGSLSMSDLAQIAAQAGFSGEEIPMMVAIAMGESGGNPGAHNPNGEDSRGLWQINVAAHGDRFQNLYDPSSNAQAAYALYRDSGYQPWTVYTRGIYKQYYDDARRAAAAAGLI